MTRVSSAEYLRLERLSETKSEYRNGAMVPMPRQNYRHCLIVTNLISEISQQLKHRPEEVYPGNLRIHALATGLYTYADLTVASSPRLEDEEQDTLLNPTLIIEILSPSTEAYDRGKEFEHYDTIESLAEYVLVSQDTPRVEQYVRQDGGRWLFTATSGLDAKVVLPSISCELALAEIYDKVPFGT